MSQERVVEDPGFARMDRRRFIKVASMAGGGIFLLACAPAAVSPTPTSAPKAAQTPTAPPKPKVSASLQFAASAGGLGLNALPMFVAEEKGYLKDEGITEEIVVFSGGGDVVRGITQGGSRLGNPSNVAVAAAFEEGQDNLRLVAENAPFVMAFWVVRADSSLKSMQDIKGKKFGYTGPGAESQIFALAALKSLGYKEGEDVQLVVVRGLPDQLAAVKTGIIDVAWTADPMASEGLLKKELRILGRPDDFVRYWSQCMICTTAEYAKEQGEVLTAYLRGYVKAIELMRTKPQEAAEIWAKRTNTAPELLQASIKNYPMEKYTAQFNPNILNSLTEMMLAHKLVKQKPAWDKIIDQSFLPPEMRVKLT